MKHPEHDLQRKVYVFLRRSLPAGAWITSIDHARKATPQQRIAMHARGVQAGIPDMVCLMAGHPSIWIELKAPGAGTLSPHQESVGQAIRRNGHIWGVADSLESVQAILQGAGIPLLATVESRAEAKANATPPRRRTSKAGGSGVRAPRPSKTALRFAQLAMEVPKL